MFGFTGELWAETGVEASAGEDRIGTERPPKALTLFHQKTITQDAAEALWIMKIVAEVRAYRQAHLDEVMSFDTPEAVLAALEGV
jgi:hypothetical protein